MVGHYWKYVPYVPEDDEEDEDDEEVPEAPFDILVDGDRSGGHPEVAPYGLPAGEHSVGALPGGGALEVDEYRVICICGAAETHQKAVDVKRWMDSHATLGDCPGVTEHHDVARFRVLEVSRRGD